MKINWGSKRQPVQQKVRFEVFKRDLFKCQYCGRTPPNVTLQVDHIIPVSGGGLSDQDNLITSCFDCNVGKGSRPLGSVPKPLSDRAEEIREQELQISEYSRIIADKRDRIESESFLVASVLYPNSKSIGSREYASIKRFVTDMGFEAVLESADIASADIASVKFNPGADRFKYFCGVCWRKIRSNK